MTAPSNLTGKGKRIGNQIRYLRASIWKERLRCIIVWGFWCCWPINLLSAVAQVKEQTTILCGSSNVIYPEGHVSRLTSKMVVHWKMSKSDDGLHMAFQYIGGQAWIGLGFSSTGSMLGSRAIIGIPSNDPTSNSTVQGYQLISKGPQTADAIDAISDFTRAHSLQGRVETKSFETVIRFSMIGFSDLQTPDEDNLYTMIYAIGKSTELGMHAHQGAFRINLQYCDDEDDHPSPSSPNNVIPTALQTSTKPSSKADEIPSPADPTPTSSPSASSIVDSEETSSGSSYDHKAAFAAHGFLATISFGVLVPTAVGSTWFRALLPKWWIYVHVLSNCAGFLCAILSVVAAFIGMVLRSQPDGIPVPHMTVSHHWTGLILLLGVAYQLVSGFCRPPAQHRQFDSGLENEGNRGGFGSAVCGWTRAIPLWGDLSRREKWHWAHRTIAVTILSLAVYQLSSGTNLYSAEYQDGRRTSVVVMWVWLALLATTFLTIKLYLMTMATKEAAGGGAESVWNKPQLVVRRRAPPPRTSSSTSSSSSVVVAAAAAAAAGVWRSSPPSRTPSSQHIQRNANLLPHRDETSREDDDNDLVLDDEPRHAELKSFTNVI